MTRWLKWRALVLIGALLALAATAMAMGSVVVCHRPPGNRANVTEIAVGAAGVASHLAHGDDKRDDNRPSQYRYFHLRRAPPRDSHAESMREECCAWCNGRSR